MRKAGGIVALVAGIFAVGAALFTLLPVALAGRWKPKVRRRSFCWDGEGSCSPS